MTREEVEYVVKEILIRDGPDQHYDGYEELTDFIMALLNDTGVEWFERYKFNKGML